MNFRTKLRLCWISLRLEFHEARLHRWRDHAHALAMSREQFEESFQNTIEGQEPIGVLNTTAASISKRRHDEFLPHVMAGIAKNQHKITKLKAKRHQLTSQLHTAS